METERRPAMRIDINADMGESFGMYQLGNDEEVMKYITSANIACGYHAGDSSVMRQTVGFAKENGVAVGAHPGYPDLQGFGRRFMALTPQEIYDEVMYQCGALWAFCQAYGTQLHHVKPHGSLYGTAHRDDEIAKAICQAVKDLGGDLYLYIMKKGKIAKIAESMGIRCVYELFSDLDYDKEGGLVITREHEHYEPSYLAQRVIGMLKDGKVKTVDGGEIDIEGNSVCVHSDTPGALDNLTAVRSALTHAGFEIGAPSL